MKANIEASMKALFILTLLPMILERLNVSHSISTAARVGTDALTFAGGISENAATIRARNYRPT